MRFKIIQLCFVMLIWFSAYPVFIMAAENAYTESNQIHCYRSSMYFVVAKDVKGRVGTDFLVKYKAKEGDKLPCTYVVGDNDFEIKNEWAEYFVAVKNSLLILDSTTGPGPSGLIIWDLQKRKKVFEGQWSDAIIQENSIVYWIETGEATDANCQGRAEWESRGLGSVIETKVILNLSNLKISKTEETRCSPRQ